MMTVTPEAMEHDWCAFDAMTDAEKQAAAISDPGAAVRAYLLVIRRNPSAVAETLQDRSPP